MNTRSISISLILLSIIVVSLFGIKNNNDIKNKYISYINVLETQTDDNSISKMVEQLDEEFKHDKKYLVLYQRKSKVDEIDDVIEEIVSVAQLHDVKALRKDLLKLKELLIDFNEKEIPNFYNIL